MVIAVIVSVIVVGIVSMTSMTIMYRMLQAKNNGGYLQDIVEKPAIIDKLTEIVQKREPDDDIDSGILNTKIDQKAIAEAQDAFSNLMN